MKTIFLSIAATLLLTFSASAQLEKIKGNRNVTKVLQDIQDFDRLVIGQDLNVRLIKSDESSVEITTDENLHDVIAVKSFEGSLTFATSANITSYKTLDITVFYTDDLKLIELKDDAELHSDITLKFKDITITTANDAEAFLTVKSDNFKFTNNGKGDSKLNITSDNIVLELNDNTTLEALLNAQTIEIDMVQRATATLEGDANTLDLNIDNSCDYNGEKLTADKAVLKAANRCDVKVDIREELTIDATQTAEVYIYGTPKVILNRFENEAIIYKKDSK